MFLKDRKKYVAESYHKTYNNGKKYSQFCSVKIQ